MGMAAMRFDGFVRYDITLFLLSIGVAVVFCFLALLARSRMVISPRYRTAVVAAIMGGAASSVHYTAMAAAYFVSGDGAAVHDGVISPGLLAVAIGTTTVLLTLLLLALSSASRSRAIALQLKENEKRLRKLTVAVEQSPSSIVMTDLKVNIVYANAAFLRQTGYTMEEVLGKNPRFLQSGKTPRQTYDALWQHLRRGEVWKGQLINRRKDGTDYTESALISPVLDDNGQGCVSSYLAIKEDITEQQQTEARLQQLAHFDQLTGLPNRTLLQDHFQFALSLAERGNEPMAVMFMDLDDFKTINDTLGHPVGDLLLMEIARRLKASVRDIDTVAHVGGDEFVFILPGTDAPGAEMCIRDRSYLVDGGGFARMYLGGLAPSAELMGSGEFQAAMWVFIGLHLPVSLLFWHAPALVFWQDLAPVKSMFFSIVACFRNFWALTVFAGLWMVVIVLTVLSITTLATLLDSPTRAGTLQFPALLMVAAMFFTSLFFTYRDSFEDPVQVSDATA